MGMGMYGIESTGNMFEELTPINNPFSTQSIVNNMANKLPVNTSSIPSIGNDVSGLDKVAGVKSEREFYQRFPTEESFFKAFPEALKSAQRGITVPGIVDGMGMGMPGIESTGNMFEELTPINNPLSTQSIVNNMASKLPVNTTSSIGNDVSGLDKVGSQLPGLAGSVTKGISQIKAQKQKLKKARSEERRVGKEC